MIKSNWMLAILLLCGMAVRMTLGELCGDSTPVVINTLDDPVVATSAITWDASWVGGNSSATVVIKDNGTEIKRAAGTGELAWTPATVGPHTLTYTTFINNVAQSEVYTVTLYSEWKYTVSNGTATITETTHKTGNVTIPDSLNGYPVIGIGSNVFNGCSSLMSVTIPTSVTSVGSNAFMGCTGLTTVSVPWSLNTPLSTLFPDAYANLTSVTMTGTTPTTIVADLYKGCTKLKSATIPSTVTSIGASAFYGCSSLTSVTIPNSVTSIGANAFYGCSGLTGGLIIPDSVTTIGDSAFSGCGGLTEVTMKPGNKTLRQLFPNAYATLTKVTLKDGPKRLPVGFFDGCSAVTQVTLPSTLTSIGLADLPPLVRASLSYDEDGFIVYQGWVLGHNDSLAEWLVLPEVKGIGASAFREFHELNEVYIPGTVKYIGANAFELCDYLDNVEIPDSVEEIGEDAFLLCSWVENLSIGVGVKHVGERAFKGCASLLSVLFPGALETVGAEAFSNDWRMLSIDLPGSVTNIGANAFKDCRGLTGVSVPAGVGTMQSLFPNAYSQIATVAVPAGADTIQANMFAGCTALADVTLPGGIESIGANAFLNCSSLPELVFPASLTSIGAGAFNGTAITNAYYLCMAAPACAADAFSTSPSNLTHYVIRGSKGWDGTPTSRVLPELWRGRAITWWTPNVFDVTFNVNGGVFPGGGTTATVSETTDAGYNLPPVNPTRPGFVFVGWWTEASGGTQVFSSTRVTMTREHTLYAHWQAKEGTFAVTFNATGGTVDPATRLVSNGMEVGELPTPTRENYSFDGWYTAMSGGTLVTATTTVDADVTYYARWTVIQYTVTFNANGGSVSPTTRTVDSGTAVGTLPTPTRTNYTFAGWYTAASGGTLVTATTTVDADVTYYARWTAIQYTVTFNANGGSVSPTTRTVNSGAAVGTLPTPTRTNYTFRGWFTAASGGTQVTASTVVSANVTYYARWTPQNLYCVIDLSGGSSATNYPVTYLDAEPSGGFNTDEYKTTKLVLRQIEAGTFIMGNDQTNESHRVTLTRPFYIGVFEVTQRQYELVTGSNPSQYTGNMRPVEKVTYNAIRGSSEGAKWPNSSLVDSGSFMGMIRLRTGLAFDLPTDAQWEYACRAGTTNDYNNGGSTEDDLKLLGRYKGNTSDGNGGYSANHTKAGSYQPNAWGLYDMHGNVWEICLDWYGTSPYGTDPKGPSSGSARMSRGGGWTASADRCTSSTQAYLESSDNRTGFRLCRTVYPEETACVVTFDANGGNVAEATRSVNVGAAVGELPTPTRAGYSFDGWFTAAVGGTRVDASLNITDDVTLYAWWIADSATRYCVIDLSGGSAATNYPVTYLAEPPTGGFNTDEYKTTKLVLRQIDPGTYQMQNVGTVTLTKPFYIGLFEVTQKQYQLVTGSNPSNFSGEKFPVEKVSYKAIRGSSNGAMWPTSSAVDEDSFMGKLRVRTGLAFDLPTEAQWEYACRAGTTTTYGYGNSVDGSYMWYKSNSSSTSHNVGSRTPNEWGLYDMHGNVDEWCLDRYGTLEYGTDPKGSSSELTRVKRGGGWYNYASNCTSSYRYGIDPSNENSNYGFRLCRTLGTQVLFHTVTFNANGGSVSPATRKVENGSMIGTLPVPTRDGYTFDGWFTAATGGTQVTATTVVNANATYYAHWARMVTFDANGGEVTPATKLMNDGVAVGELPIPTRDNYIFIGWFTAATGGTQVTATTVVTGAVTYYAHWKIVREEDGGTVEYFEATVGGYTWTYTVGHDGGATLASIRVVTNDTGSVSDWGSDTSDDGTTGGDTGVDCGWEYYQICVSPEPDGAMAIPASLDGHPVTGIGDHAFDGCGGLTGVTIPESVKEIGRYAFYDCSELAGIELPSGLESIGEGAFEGCASLSSVDFPQGLVWIDSLTFSGCSSLEQVTLPTSLKVIDYGAFEGCVSLGSVDFPEGLVRIDSDAFNGCSSLEQIALPSSLRVIGHGVFSECSSLSSVTVPSGVTSLGYALFEDCSSLTEVAILTETANVCDDTFCGWTPPVSLRRVLLPGSFEWIVTLPRMREHGVEVVYGNAFTEPLSPNAGTNEYFEATACGYTWTYTVEHDGGATLVGIRVVTNDTGSVSDWGDDSGDTGDDSSDTVGDTGGIWWEDYQICVSPEPDGALVIPPTLDGHPVTGIGDHAFDGCGGLTGVTIPESVNEIGRYAFYGCSALEHVTLPSGLKVIGECAFGDCASLGSVDLPEGLVRIDSYAFSGCSSLQSATVPFEVTSLGYELFEDCSSLAEVAILTAAVDVDDGTFCGWTPPASLRRILLPGSFEWIVTLPRMREHGVEIVYGNAFTEPLSPDAGTNEYFEATVGGYTWTYTVGRDGGATLASIRVVTNDTGSVSDWGGDTSDDGTTGGDTGGNCDWEYYQICVSPEPDGALAIPASLDGHPVTGIGNHAFDCCGGLTGVTIPESVKEIGRCAFYGCSALEHVTLPSGLKVIGECAFGDCASLGSVDLPEGLVRIDSYAFSGCSSLGQITLPSSLRVIGHGVFVECSSLCSATIPSGVTSLGYALFEDCSLLTEVAILTAAVDVDDGTFCGWTPPSSLRRILLPGSFEWIVTLPGMREHGVEVIYGNTFTVMFNATGGEVVPLTRAVEKYTVVGELPIPTRNGYAFVGWYTAKRGGTRITAATVVTDSVIYYAHWTINRYSVTFDANGGVGGTVREVAYGERLGGLPEVTRSGYVFAGWFTEVVGGTQVTAETVVTGAVTYYAHWMRMVTFDANGGEVTPATKLVNDGVAVGELPIPTRTNYTFGGWFTAAEGGTQVTAATVVSGAVTYYAHWTVIQYTVTFNPYGGEVAETTRIVNSGLAIGELPVAVREGYVFKGWFTAPRSSVKVSAETVVTADVTYYARWAVAYTVTFDANGGEVAETTRTVASGVAVGGLPTPTRGDYAFIGWFTAAEGGDQVSDEMVVTEDVTFYAHWMLENLYCVIDLSGGLSATNYPVTYLDAEPSGGFNTDEYKTTKLVLKKIEVGTFIMGDDQTNESHRVTLTRPFYIGLFEVTQKQYQLVTGSNPANFSGEKRPVEKVSYSAIRGSSNGAMWPTSSAVDETSFMGKLRARTGLAFDLPTEAQWEYACRAGTTTTYSYGDSADGNYMWYSSNSSKATHDVGSKNPNPWGLYDMHGNVWERCLDWYGTLTYGTDPQGGASGTDRVLRGGSWYASAASASAFSRDHDTPSYVTTARGFRLCRTVYPKGTVYVVTFDANGGNVSPATRAIAVGSVIGELPTPTRVGYSFDGWFTDSEGGTRVGGSLSITEDVTLYAHWIADSATRYCVIDLSGGTNTASYPVAYLAEPPEGGFNTDEYKTTKLVLRQIDPGTYQMQNVGTVTLTEPFFIGLFEVTQKQYELVTGSNPSQYAGDTRPVEMVSYYSIRGGEEGVKWPVSAAVDADSFMGWIRTRTGLVFDLPTDAQWEYACRAGTASDYNNGGSTVDDLKLLGRYSANKSDGKGGYSEHTIVGSYQPNAWGLYDMHGNVWEWCLDWSGTLAYGTDPKGPSSGSRRVLRGGSWCQDAGVCSALNHTGNYTQDGQFDRYGFRLCRTLGDQDLYSLVTLDANGGEVAETTRTVVNGVAVGELPTPTRANYTFGGWFTAAEGGTQVTAATVVTDAVTYYAHWTIIRYTVTFDANGGNVGEATRTVENGEAVGELPTPTRDGYVFIGWFTAATGGTQVTAETTVTADATYYARWAAPNPYTVTFNPYGGEVAETTRIVNGGSAIGELPTPTREGYVFKGWFTAPRSTIKITAETVVTADATYYARWAVARTVTFDANGGAVSETTRTVASGVAVGELPTPTHEKEEYLFLGWFTATDGGTQVTVETTVTEDVTYYAHWTLENLYCVIDLSGGASATNYPVTYLNEAPEGGFNTEQYKMTKLVLRKIEAGTFIMGSDQANESHRVTLTKPFYIGLFEVTQNQHQLITGGGNSQYGGSMRPSERVAYNSLRGSTNGTKWPLSSAVDATSLIGKLRARTGLNIDLPTEAQWEYACRAGTTSTYNNGGSTTNDLNLLGRYSGNQSDDKGWYSEHHTTVGSYQPNAWGLYDMHGNVMEWCLDWMGTLSYGTDPKGPASATTRSVRGGGWDTSSVSCTSHNRGNGTPIYGSTRGFRLCQTIYPEETACTVTFDANGGEGTMVSQTLVPGRDPLSPCAFTRSDYRFTGWATNVNGEVIYQDLENAEPAGDVTLYAVWEYVDPIPEVAGDAEVAGALAGSVDERLATNITDKAMYDAYRAWADRRGLDHGTVKAHPRAWLSFALDAAGLIAREPAAGDLAIDSFEPTSANGRFELLVSLKDVAIGPNALEANLAKVFGIEGCATLGSGFSTSGVSVKFGTPRDGKVMVTAGPRTSRTSFFMRVKMK